MTFNNRLTLEVSENHTYSINIYAALKDHYKYLFWVDLEQKVLISNLKFKSPSESKIGQNEMRIHPHQ